MSLSRLYDISAEYNAVMADIEAADGVLSEELEARHDAIVARLASSAANVKAAKAMCEHGIAELDEWMDKLATRKRSLEREIERWKEAAMSSMEGMGINRLEGVLNGLPAKLAVMEAKQSVQIDDEEKIPKKFKRYVPAKYESDKAKIADALKAEKKVPGATLLPGKKYLKVW